MATKKGRPQKNNNNILINDINVEYLSTKVDKFDNSIVYLKLTKIICDNIFKSPKFFECISKIKIMIPKNL